MRIKKDWSSPGSTVAYMIDAGNGMYSTSQMPAPVALEIAENAKDLKLVTVNGVEYLHIDDRHFIPAEVFDLRGREIEREEEDTPAPRRTRKKA
ncbi:MAG: hypothetical protein J6D54_03530 [Olsenella sp.]|nr:hypothetical protein [Olsenella sp.]